MYINTQTNVSPFKRPIDISLLSSLPMISATNEDLTIKIGNYTLNEETLGVFFPPTNCMEHFKRGLPSGYATFQYGLVCGNTNYLKF